MECKFDDKEKLKVENEKLKAYLKSMKCIVYCRNMGIRESYYALESIIIKISE